MLPMWPAAVLVGRSITDVLAATTCTLTIIVSGLVVGWRPETGAVQIAAGFGIAILVVCLPLASMLYRRRTTD
jgi:hypothetical protein